MMSNIRLLSLFKREHNFRELGGYATADGHHIKEGVFYRSAALASMSDEELNNIRKLGIKTIVDFRSSAERNEFPDPEIPGIRNIHLSAMRDESGRDIDYSPKQIIKNALRSQRGSIVETNIDHFYDFLIFDNTAYRQFFRLLLDDQTPILFHCTAGKDRTGVAAILILLALGVREETIEKDYLLTNKYRCQLILDQPWLLRLLGHLSKNIRTMMLFSQGVLPHGCRFVLNEIKRRYPSRQAYLKNELGLTPENMTYLRKRYLE